MERRAARRACAPASYPAATLGREASPERMARAAMLALCLLASLAAQAAPEPESSLYMWTDSFGVVRYTTSPDRVPSSARETLLRVVPGMPALPPTWNIPEPEPLPPPPPGSLAGPGGAALASVGPPPDTEATLPVASEPTAPEPFNEPDQARAVEEGPVARARPRTPAATPPVPAAPPAASGSRATSASEAAAAAAPAPVREPTVPPAVASTPGEPAKTPEPAPEDLDARIRALRAAIARDEEALRGLVSGRDADGVPLRDSPELREIARRLPAQQAKLQALEAQRAGSGGGS